jgi:hypothetical protein
MADAIAISLSRGKVAWIDAEDYPLVAGVKWFARKAKWTWYATRQVQRNGVRVRVSMQEQIIGKRLGFIVDHDDNDGLNNRRANLRHATYGQNAANRAFVRRGRKGVTRTKHGTFKATIQRDGAALHLGTYKREADAQRIYDLSARAIFGEFAKLNFPDEALAA